MKNAKIIFLFVICSLLSGICYTQWQPDVRLTNSTGVSITSYNNAWGVASSGNVVHVVWTDDRDGNQEIYYKRSTNSGSNWGTDIRLTNNPSVSWLPSVFVSGSVAHVVWEDNRDGNFEIYYKRSTDGGISWGQDSRLTNNSANSGTPSAAVSGSAIHVVWDDERDGNQEIYYKRSTDGGVSWGTDMRLTNNNDSSLSPSVAITGTFVHVIWYDTRDGNYEIYYKRSTDGGISWGGDTRLTSNPALSAFPCIAVSGSVVHVVWTDERDGNAGIYYKRSTNGGISWGNDTRMTPDSVLAFMPSIVVSGSVVHIVWNDNRDDYIRDTDPEIYYKRSTNGGLSWEQDTRLTVDYADSFYPSVAVSGQVVHVVWLDTRDADAEIYYKRNPTGNSIGIINISSEVPNQFSLSQNYPNPFNPLTKIRFALPKNSFASLVIYDMLGREIETIVNEQLNAGTYEADWSADKFSSGVYYYKLVTEDYTETKKMVLIK